MIDSSSLTFRCIESLTDVMPLEKLLKLRKVVDKQLQRYATQYYVAINKNYGGFWLDDLAIEFIHLFRPEVSPYACGVQTRIDPVIIFAILFLVKSDNNPSNTINIIKLAVSPEHVFKINEDDGMESIQIVESSEILVIPTRPPNLHKEIVRFATEKGIELNADGDVDLPCTGPYKLLDDDEE